tara:strand:+ start:236 stop:646 length:411 start_codon:yes stop_codon:yes gene_type:complete
MNDQKSWDPTLVKKFSSSSHFKLLNQLKNEVKKYPLTKKKNQTTLREDNKIDKNNNHNLVNPQETYNAKKKNINNDSYSNESNVSFNNSKNFSIYNNKVDDPNKHPKESNDNEENPTSNDQNSSTFKDRLKSIDMK